MTASLFFASYSRLDKRDSSKYNENSGNLVPNSVGQTRFYGEWTMKMKEWVKDKPCYISKAPAVSETTGIN